MKALGRLGLLLLAVAPLACGAGRAEKQLAVRIAALERDTARMRNALDSLLARQDTLLRQRDSLALRIRSGDEESARREEQLRALRLELERIKEIDLRRRSQHRAPVPPGS